MGKLRLKLAQVMPHVWFHKLKEIGKSHRYALTYKRPSQSRASSSSYMPAQHKKHINIKGPTCTHIAQAQIPERTAVQSPLPLTAASNLAPSHGPPPAPPASSDKSFHLDMEELESKLKALSSQERRQYHSASPVFSKTAPSPALIDDVHDKANHNIQVEVGRFEARKLFGDDMKPLYEGSRSSHGSTSFTCDLLSVTSDNRASSSLWERDLSSFTSESNSELFSVVEEMQSYYHGASLIGRRSSSTHLRREPESKQKKTQNRGRSTKLCLDVTDDAKTCKKRDAMHDMRTTNGASLYDLNCDALYPCKAGENMQDVTAFCEGGVMECLANEKVVRLSPANGMPDDEECRYRVEGEADTEDGRIQPDKPLSAEDVTFGQPRQPAVMRDKLSPAQCSDSALSDGEIETGGSHNNGSFKAPPHNEFVLGRSKSMHETKTVHEYSDDGSIKALSAYRDVYPKLRKHNRQPRNTKSRGFCRNLHGTLCSCQRNPLLFADSSLYATPSHSPLSCKSAAYSYKDVADDADFAIHCHKCTGSRCSSVSKGPSVQKRPLNAKMCDEDHRWRPTTALTDECNWREYKTNVCDVRKVAKGAFEEPSFNSKASKPSKNRGLEKENVCDARRDGCGNGVCYFQKDDETNAERGREGSWYKGALRIVREKADHVSNEKSSNLGKVYDSFAMVKCSNDPSQDFKESMMEMILHKKLHHSMDMVELLQCYLALNSPRYHDTIVKVFIDLWCHLFRPPH